MKLVEDLKLTAQIFGIFARRLKKASIRQLVGGVHGGELFFRKRHRGHYEEHQLPEFTKTVRHQKLTVPQ